MGDLRCVRQAACCMARPPVSHRFFSRPSAWHTELTLSGLPPACRARPAPRPRFSGRDGRERPAGCEAAAEARRAPRTASVNLPRSPRWSTHQRRIPPLSRQRCGAVLIFSWLFAPAPCLRHLVTCAATIAVVTDGRGGGTQSTLMQTEHTVGAWAPPPITLRRSRRCCAIEVARRGASRGGLTPPPPPPFHPARCKRPRLKNGPPPRGSPERFSLFFFPSCQAHTDTPPRAPRSCWGRRGRSKRAGGDVPRHRRATESRRHLSPAPACPSPTRVHTCLSRWTAGGERARA